MQKEAMPVTPASAGKRKRNLKSIGSPQTPQAVLPEGSDLTILVKPKELGGIVHQLQPAIIPEIIARFGYKWHYSAINKELPPIIRSAIKRFNIGGYGPVYDQLREADPKAEIKMVRKLRSSQAHCVKSHHGQLALVVSSLFTESHEEDELTIKVKKLVFDIDGGAPIIDRDHPLMRELAALSKGACAQRLACMCLVFEAASSFQFPSISLCCSRLRIRSIAEKPPAWASKTTTIRKPSPRF